MKERETQREQVYLKADSLAGGALFNTIRAAGTNGSMRPLGPDIQTCHAIPWVGEWVWERQARCGQLRLWPGSDAPCADHIVQMMSASRAADSNCGRPNQ